MQTIYFYMISISILDNLQACMYLLAFFMIYYQFRAISSENQCLGYACSPHAEMPPLQFYRNRVFVYIVCLVYCFFFLFIYLFSILLNKLFSFLSFFSLGFITYPQIILLIFSMKRLCSLLLPVTRWLSPSYCACHCPDFPPVWLPLRRTAPPSEGLLYLLWAIWIIHYHASHQASSVQYGWASTQYVHRSILLLIVEFAHFCITELQIRK